MFHLFETLILPILTYGRDVWGSNKITLTILDRVFLQFIRCTLGIKCTTSNITVLGVCGRMPLSVMCAINTLCFFNRLNCTDDDSLVKQVHMELQRLTEQGFDTWVSSLCKLADSYQLNAYVDPNKFRQECKTKWHQAITWTNVGLSSLRSGDFHLMVISIEIPQASITKISWNVTYLKFC